MANLFENFNRFVERFLELGSYGGYADYESPEVEAKKEETPVVKTPTQVVRLKSDSSSAHQEKEAQKLAFNAKPFVVCAIPQTEPVTSDGSRIIKYSKRDGKAYLELVADPDYGLPYGPDRHFLRLLATKIAQLDSPIIPFKDGVSLLRSMGLTNTGPNLKWLGEAIMRCHHTSIYYVEGDPLNGGKSVVDHIITEVSGFFKEDKKKGKKEKYFRVSRHFYDFVKVPTDENIIKKLGKNYTAMDLYTYLNHRLYKDHAPGVFRLTLDQLRNHLGVSNDKEDKYFKRELKTAVKLLNKARFYIEIGFEEDLVLITKKKPKTVLSDKHQKAFAYLDAARSSLSNN
jgi:hypothetical protein